MRVLSLRFNFWGRLWLYFLQSKLDRYHSCKVRYRLGMFIMVSIFCDYYYILLPMLGLGWILLFELRDYYHWGANIGTSVGFVWELFILYHYCDAHGGSWIDIISVSHIFLLLCCHERGGIMIYWYLRWLALIYTIIKLVYCILLSWLWACISFIHLNSWNWYYWKILCLKENKILYETP